jgi:hypothetical protein
MPRMPIEALFSTLDPSGNRDHSFTRGPFIGTRLTHTMARYHLVPGVLLDTGVQYPFGLCRAGLSLWAN